MSIRLPAAGSLLFLGAFLTLAATAAPQNTPRACRSIHMVYKTDQAVAYANEVTIQNSAPGTYFCVCGWDQGYCGLQQLPNGKKRFIFSVWDSVATNDPKAVKEEDRTKMIFKDEQVTIGRFGGEGTGGQSFLDLDWKAGETYRFMVSAKVAGRRTEYTGHLFMPDTKAWKKLVTFSTPGNHPVLADCHSFVEDFLRNGDSATHARKAVFGNGWTQDAKGAVTPITQGRFTADRTPSNNVDAGTAGGRFFLATGGETANTGTPLWKEVTLPANDKRAMPADLPWPLPVKPPAKEK